MSNRQKLIKWKPLIKIKEESNKRENKKQKKIEYVRRFKCVHCTEFLYFRTDYTEDERQNQQQTCSLLKNKACKQVQIAVTLEHVRVFFFPPRRTKSNYSAFPFFIPIPITKPSC